MATNRACGELSRSKGRSAHVSVPISKIEGAFVIKLLKDNKSH